MLTTLAKRLIADDAYTHAEVEAPACVTHRYSDTTRSMCQQYTLIDTCRLRSKEQIVS